MGEPEEIDVEQIMDRIRENIQRRRTGEEGLTPSREQARVSPASMLSHTGQGESSPIQADHQVVADLAALRSSYDVYHIYFSSHRKIVGPFVIFLKKLLQKLLTPILERQVSYNATNARIAAHLKEELEALRLQMQLRQKLSERQAKELQAIAELQAQLRDDVLGTLSQEIRRLQNEVPTGHAQAFEVVRKQVSGAERKLRRILYLLTDGQAAGEGFTPSRRAEGTIAQGEPIQGSLQVLEPDFDYFAFEERFRGSEEDVKQRQRNYVEYFQGKGDVLDIGCGRGEFLELLKEAGITAKGVDLDLDMALYCQDKGLDVIRVDVFSHLEALADESLGGIFAAQVIEHLEPSQIIRLVKLSHRKLSPEGILILETPNPKCLTVFSESFYMDFSHIRPVHPEAMKFLFDSLGFDQVELRFSSPVIASMRLPLLSDGGTPPERSGEFNRGVERLNDLLYGPQDYAVIGKKSPSR